MIGISNSDVSILLEINRPNFSGMSSTGCDSLVRGNLRADNVRTGNEQEVVRKSHRYSSVGECFFLKGFFLKGM